MSSHPLAALAILGSAAAVFSGCADRHASADSGSAPTVAVAQVGRRDLYREVTLQAELRPYQEVDLDAKVTGYLKTITVDFGDQVKAGQLLATIEVPELHDQLEQANATEQKAEATQANAHLDYTRLADVNRSQPNLIAQQDLDAARAQDLAAAAAVSAARAEADRYRTLMTYTRIVAPFSGVITARYADPGALIRGEGQGAPLVRLSENDLLRVDFPVSVADAQQISVGDTVWLRLEGSDRQIPARISRFARRIATATRTMNTEVELPNPGLKLIPGGYATVTLRLQPRPNAVAVPVEAINPGAAPTVDVVGADHRIEERPVKLGLETPQYDEVLAGLNPGEWVVTAGRNSLEAGETVNPRPEAAAAQP